MVKLYQKGNVEHLSKHPMQNVRRTLFYPFERETRGIETACCEIACLKQCPPKCCKCPKKSYAPNRVVHEPGVKRLNTLEFASGLVK